MVNKLGDFEALNWSTIASNNESDQVVGHKIPLIRFGKEQPSSFSRVHMDRSRTGPIPDPAGSKSRSVETGEQGSHDGLLLYYYYYSYYSSYPLMILPGCIIFAMPVNNSQNTNQRETKLHREMSQIPFRSHSGLMHCQFIILFANPIFQHSTLCLSLSPIALPWVSVLPRPLRCQNIIEIKRQ